MNGNPLEKQLTRRKTREERLEGLVNGKVMRNSRGQYLLIQRPLSDIEQTPVVEYLHKSLPHVKVGQAIEEFPLVHLQRRARERMLFWDIETCGADYFSQVISIAGLSLHLGAGKQPSVKLFEFFARNPSEEPGIIKAFLETVSQYDHVFTYNGQTFDFNRLTRRALANRIPLDPKYSPHLKYVLPSPTKHTDLYPIVRDLLGKNRIIDGKAKTAEIAVWNYRRTDDIGGAQIGRAYKEYLGMEDSPTTRSEKEVRLDVARIIEHNLLDVIACGAIFAKLCLDGNLSRPKT